MNLKIKSISDKGDFEKERLVLRVLADADVGDYILLRAGFFNGKVTIGVKNTKWFQYKAVSAGDLVVVYTKSGTDSEKAIKDNATAHFFYWGLDKPIWDEKDVAPVIVYAPEWESKDPNDL